MKINSNLENPIPISKYEITHSDNTTSILDDRNQNALQGALLLVLDGRGNQNGVPDANDNPTREFLTYQEILDLVENPDGDPQFTRLRQLNPKLLNDLQAELTRDNNSPRSIALLRALAVQMRAANENVVVTPTWIPLQDGSNVYSLVFTKAADCKNTESNLSTIILPGDCASPSLYAEKALTELKSGSDLVITLDFIENPASAPITQWNVDWRPRNNSDVDHALQNHQKRNVAALDAAIEHLAPTQSIKIISHSIGETQLLHWMNEGLNVDQLSQIESYSGAWSLHPTNRFWGFLMGKTSVLANKLPLGKLTALIPDTATATLVKNQILGSPLIGWYNHNEYQTIKRTTGLDDPKLNNVIIPVDYSYTISSQDNFVDAAGAIARLMHQPIANGYSRKITVILEGGDTEKEITEQIRRAFKKQNLNFDKSQITFQKSNSSQIRGHFWVTT